MTKVEKRTVSLPSEQADYIDAQVSSGSYSSASEVVRAGLRALQQRDEAVDRWLRQSIAPAYDAMTADPSGAIPAGQVFADLRAHHAERVKTARGA